MPEPRIAQEVVVKPKARLGRVVSDAVYLDYNSLVAGDDGEICPILVYGVLGYRIQSSAVKCTFPSASRSRDA